MRDRVIVPTYRRPELLQVCLEHIYSQAAVAELDVQVCVDNHTYANGLAPIEEIKQVVDKFYAPNLKLKIREPHSYEGNSYNVLTAYADAYNDGCEHVFEVEDDIMVSHDFFAWQYKQFQKSQEWFAVIGARNFRTPVPKDAVDCFTTCSEDLVSWGVGYPRKTLEKILPHVNHDYFSNMPNYVTKTFPWFKGSAAFSEQDGLLQRVMLQNPVPVVWSVPVRAYHCGWWGYHRPTNIRPTGTLEQRVQQVRDTLNDSERLKTLSRIYFNDVEYNASICNNANNSR